jgi:hypothetical protein
LKGINAVMEKTRLIQSHFEAVIIVVFMLPSSLNLRNKLSQPRKTNVKNLSDYATTTRKVADSLCFVATINYDFLHESKLLAPVAWFVHCRVAVLLLSPGPDG